MEERRRLDVALADHARLAEQVKEERAALAGARRSLRSVLQAQAILQGVAEQVQAKAHSQVAGVVSKCLSAVFERPYELRVELERRRGKTEVDFAYCRDGRRIDPRMTSGGVMDVVSMALRLISLTLAQPPRRKLLVLDEPFKGLDAESLRKMGLLLESLAHDLDMQFVIVTHSEALQVGEVIRLWPR